ncbi:MAG TPA: hypothetical protein DCZ12_15900 [Gammaproteobacteria bacterium]|nr:hypothetical protein [Gammaproteobacteria bacterium]
MAQYAPIAVAALDLLGGAKESKAVQASKRFQAEQLDRNAGQVEAASQKQASEERRQAELLASRARAVAAAGGTTTTDVGIMNELAKIDKEGEYNALTALYEGRAVASTMRGQSRALALEAKQSESIYTTLFSGFG